MLSVDNIKLFVEEARPAYWWGLLTLITTFAWGIYLIVKHFWTIGLYLVGVAVLTPIVSYIVVKRVYEDN